MGKCQSVQSCSDCVKSYDNVTNECVWSPANELCHSKKNAMNHGYKFVQNCNGGIICFRLQNKPVSYYKVPNIIVVQKYQIFCFHFRFRK